MSDISSLLPLSERDYDNSDVAKAGPVLLFGVYMSRMDSNIAEALESVPG